PRHARLAHHAAPVGHGARAGARGLWHGLRVRRRPRRAVPGQTLRAHLRDAVARHRIGIRRRSMGRRVAARSHRRLRGGVLAGDRPVRELGHRHLARRPAQGAPRRGAGGADAARALSPTRATYTRAVVTPPVVTSLEEWAKRPRAVRLARLGRTPDELAAALRGMDPSVLTRRPDEKNWAPIEILCHLRDAEAAFLNRLRSIRAPDEPRFPTENPNRMAEERQYLQQPLGPALEAFHRHRDASIMFFAALGEGDWARAGHQMDSRGRRTIDDFLGV